MKTGVIIQARTSSTRLPFKVLKQLPYGSGITALQQVIRRVKRSEKIDEIIVATTENNADKEIVTIARKEGVSYFRGSEENVLERYYLAAKEGNIDAIVRITSDCPCIDPEIIDMVIDRHFERKADYTSNVLKRSYPVGLDVEVFDFNILEEAYRNAGKDYEKEHVTPYINNNSHIYKISGIEAPKELFAPEIRITLDTIEDYILLCIVFDNLYLSNENFNAYDIMKLINTKPWIGLINEKIVSKKIFDTLEEELEELVNIAGIQKLDKARDYMVKHMRE